ncbi:hypothetical protein ACFLT2_01340 [Acidobacteriota bacterium]
MKKLVAVILYPIVWIVEKIDWGAFIFCGVWMTAVTFLELNVFHIPSKYETVIWICNILIAFFIFVYAVNTKKKEYEEELNDCRNRHDSYVRGIPNEDDDYLFEAEIEEIGKKYYGEEAFHRVREFTIKRRAELMLDDIRESIEAVLRRRNNPSI